MLRRRASWQTPMHMRRGWEGCFRTAGVVSLGMCAAQGAPCKRAGGLWVRSGEHAAIAKERAVRMPCYRAARIRTPPRPQRLGGKLLGFRHTARRRLRRAVCVKQSGAGVAGAGCDGAESAADAVSAAPPSGKCGGGAWPWLWAAHPREAMDKRRLPSCARRVYTRGAICHICVCNIFSYATRLLLTTVPQGPTVSHCNQQ